MTTTDATTTSTKPVLYWSERGQIGCAIPTHAPYRGTDTCWDEKDDAAGSTGEHGASYP